jgi:hypothetical protein
VFSQRLANLTCLQRQFTGRDEDQGLDMVLVWIDLFQDGNDKGRSLSSAVLCTREYISASQGNWDAFLFILEISIPLE